jgi:hypothetical protein
LRNGFARAGRKRTQPPKTTGDGNTTFAVKGKPVEFEHHTWRDNPEMIRTKSLLVVFLLFSFGTVFAEKIPDSAWQTGTLRNVTSDTRSRVIGMYNNGQGMVGEQIRIITHYSIETPQYIYEAERTTRRHDKSLNVTINGQVKIAVEGMDLYIYDDVGKVHKLMIATKTLKSDVGAK